ncbi:MAG: hypothetical protein ACTSSF_10745, partial [Candidatus Heimdallarchaeaceae archaeon]
ISLADTKAWITLSIQTLLISMGMGSSILNNSVNFMLSSNFLLMVKIFYIVMLVLFISSTFSGLFVSILVYVARPFNRYLKKEKSRKKEEISEEPDLLYFGIRSFSNLANYSEVITSLDEENIKNEYLKCNFRLSRIADSKLKYVNLSIILLLPSIIFTIVFIIFSIYIGTL